MELQIPNFLAPSELPKFIEQIIEQAIDADQVLSDEQLERGGLVRVEAFMRTKTSAAAARKAKQRETQEAAGIKQANIVAPAAVVETLKHIAKACATGDTIEKAILANVPTVTSHVLVTPDPELATLAEIGRKVKALTGWKRMIAKTIGIV